MLFEKNIENPDRVDHQVNSCLDNVYSCFLIMKFLGPANRFETRNYMYERNIEKLFDENLRSGRSKFHSLYF